MSKSHGRRTSARSATTRSADKYNVGYSRPPKDYQFKPGKSGNPKGRPKGAKSEATILHGILHERIEVQQAGRPRKISTLEALLLKCRNAALGGDLKALAFLLNRFGLIDDSEPDAEAPLDQNDREILETFVQQLQADLKKKKE